MRVIIQSFNDAAGVREIGAMCNGAASVVVVEHGDARHEFPTLTRPNLGRDYGAFVYYIVQAYDELEGSYVFTSANLDKHDRRKRLRERLRPGYAPVPLKARPRRSGTVDAATVARARGTTPLRQVVRGARRVDVYLLPVGRVRERSRSHRCGN